MQLPGAEFGAFRWGYTVDPPLPGLTAQAADHARPAAARHRRRRWTCCTRSTTAPRPTPSTLPSIAPGRPAVRRRHDLGQQRHGVRPLPHAASRADPRAVRRRSQPASPRPRAFGSPVAQRAGSRRCSTRPRSPTPTIGQPVATGRARRGRRSGGDGASGVTSVVVLAGSGDGIVDAAAAGLLHGDEAVLYAADLRSGDRLDDADLVIVTDSNRDRAHQWRGTQDVVGFTETGGPGADVLRPRHGRSTPARVRRRRRSHTRRPRRSRDCDVRATGYGEPFAYRPEDRPAMAVDGDPSTAWVVGDRSDPIGQSIEVSGDVSTTVVAAIAATRRVTNDLRGATRLRQRPVASRRPRRTIVDRNRPAHRGTGGRDIRTDHDHCRRHSPGERNRSRTIRCRVRRARPRSAPRGCQPAEPTRRDVPADTPLAVVLTRLRTDPLNRWRSDPEPQMVRDFTIGTDRDVCRDVHDPPQ